MADLRQFPPDWNSPKVRIVFTKSALQLNLRWLLGASRQEPGTLENRERLRVS